MPRDIAKPVPGRRARHSSGIAGFSAGQARRRRSLSGLRTPVSRETCHCGDEPCAAVASSRHAPGRLTLSSMRAGAVVEKLRRRVVRPDPSALSGWPATITTVRVAAASSRTRASVHSGQTGQSEDRVALRPGPHDVSRGLPVECREPQVAPLAPQAADGMDVLVQDPFSRPAHRRGPTPPGSSPGPNRRGAGRRSTMTRLHSRRRASQGGRSAAGTCWRETRVRARSPGRRERPPPRRPPQEPAAVRGGVLKAPGVAAGHAGEGCLGAPWHPEGFRRRQTGREGRRCQADRRLSAERRSWDP